MCKWFIAWDSYSEGTRKGWNPAEPLAEPRAMLRDDITGAAVPGLTAVWGWLGRELSIHFPSSNVFCMPYMC